MKSIDEAIAFVEPIANACPDLLYCTQCSNLDKCNMIDGTPEQLLRNLEELKQMEEIRKEIEKHGRK